MHGVRRVANAFVVVCGLVIALPAVALGERLRSGSGRRIALRAIRVVSRLCGIRYVVSGDASASVPGSVSRVYVPNHSSPLDIPAMLMARDDLRFAAAAELFRVPLLGAAVRALGSVPIDRSNPRAATAALAELVASREPFALVVFAEGGIPEPGSPIDFKAGAFLLAIEAGAEVVGVAITGTADVLPRRQKVLVRPGVVDVRLLEPVPTTGMGPRDRKVLRRETQDAVVAALGAAR